MKKPIYFEYNGITYCHQRTESPEQKTFYRHMHNDYEILYIANGDCSYVIEDKTYKLKNNTLTVIKPGNYHFIQIDSDTPYERYDLFINPIKEPRVELLDEVEIIDCANEPLITDTLKRFDIFCTGLNEEDFFYLYDSLVRELMFSIIMLKNNVPVIESYEQIPIVSQILDYIDQNYCNTDNVKEIAEANYVSEAYLFRLFKKHLKISPHKYITDKRLLLAQKLISQGVRPTAVSEKCGFNDYTTFFKSYTKHFGRSPSADYKES